MRTRFDRYRNKAAYKLGNPRILQITFHTLRHWKATYEYHRTKYILRVTQLLGHRNIKNTLLCKQLLDCKNDNEFVCKVAKTVNEAQTLVETEFEYVCDIDGLKLLRKRK